MARLLKHVRFIDETILTVEDMLHAKKYDVIVQGAQIAAGFNAVTGSFKVPSLALKLGYELKRYAVLLKKSFLMKEDEAGLMRVRYFEDILTFWRDDVSCHAHRNLTHIRELKPLAIPLASDIQKLSDHLKRVQADAYEILKSGDYVVGYHTLSRVLLARLVLFNRRRAGEAGRVKITSFEQRLIIGPDDEILNILDEEEKRLVKVLSLMKSVGKNDKLLPIILTKGMVRGIITLLEQREKVKDLANNDFLFANVSGTGHADVYRILSTFARDAALDQPQLITTRSLRRHVATMSRIIWMKDEDKEEFRALLGHSRSVFESFYRKPMDVAILAKTSKVLFAMEKGDVQKYANKTLEEIHIDEDTLLDDVLDFDDPDDLCPSDHAALPPTPAAGDEEAEFDSSLFDVSCSEESDSDSTPKTPKTPKRRNTVKRRKLVAGRTAENIRNWANSKKRSARKGH
ncbi:hypothetical protein ONE63_003380 [Megalurothrips usitatus]|uniref:Uncharacterized protein n=1 Tax=Megalurothrips usitatus TaxID=439358 RepID=A0AAV7XD55_9NEOP|nr:hypothetical protein ONE63_003380 [Megalurothrips usitatus]